MVNAYINCRNMKIGPYVDNTNENWLKYPDVNYATNEHWLRSILMLIMLPWQRSKLQLRRGSGVKRRQISFEIVSLLLSSLQETIFLAPTLFWQIILPLWQKNVCLYFSKLCDFPVLGTPAGCDCASVVVQTASPAKADVEWNELVMTWVQFWVLHSQLLQTLVQQGYLCLLLNLYFHCMVIHGPWSLRF